MNCFPFKNGSIVTASKMGASMHTKPPEGMIKPPWYEKGGFRPKFNRLKQDEVKNLGAEDGGDGVRLFDYYRVQEILNKLPTLKQRIDFVNPFERDWIIPEAKWHRKFMPSMMQSRKAYRIPATPSYFEVLNFYKHITKTRLVDDGEESARIFNDYYSGINLPTEKFENRIVEALLCHFHDRKVAERAASLSSQDETGGLDAIRAMALGSTAQKSNVQREQDKVMEYFKRFQKHSWPNKKIGYHRDEDLPKLFRLFVEEALMALSPANTRKFLNRRVSFTPRCESFWIRSGFRSLYRKREVYTDEIIELKTRLTCDDRRRLGEFAFTMRDELMANIRDETPTKNIFEWTDKRQLEASVFPTDFDVEKNVIFLPKMFNLHPDPAPLFQCPGYDYDVGETHRYGRLAVKDVSELNTRIATHWKPSSKTEHDEMLVDSLKAQAIASLFSWLNGQAHCIGHTQFTDIEAPLTSQLVLTDGRMFFFALGQLNTIAINIDVQGFNNSRTNTCVVDGPHFLYERYEPETGTFFHREGFDVSSEKGNLNKGLNPHVLQRFLQMFMI